MLFLIIERYFHIIVSTLESDLNKINLAFFPTIRCQFLTILILFTDGMTYKTSLSKPFSCKKTVCFIITIENK